MKTSSKDKNGEYSEYFCENFLVVLTVFGKTHSSSNNDEGNKNVNSEEGSNISATLNLLCEAVSDN